MTEDYKPFLVSYRHDGAEYSLTIMATDMLDCRRRMGNISMGRVDGVVEAKIPANLGWFARLFVFWKNWTAP